MLSPKSSADVCVATVCNCEMEEEDSEGRTTTLRTSDEMYDDEETIRPTGDDLGGEGIEGADNAIGARYLELTMP